MWMRCKSNSAWSYLCFLPLLPNLASTPIISGPTCHVLRLRPQPTTVSSCIGVFPRGLSPDSTLPSHIKPISARHQAAASTVDTEIHHHHHQGCDEMMTSQQPQQQGLAGPQPITPELLSDLPPQPSDHPIPGNTNLHWGDGGNPYSDGHLETSPDVRAVASSGQAAVEGSPGLGNEARLSASVVSHHTNRSRPANDVSVGEGAPRPASVEGIKQKPTTAGKEECAFSFKPTPFRLVHFSCNKDESY